MCAERKPEFDVASNAEKRKIATEVVEAVMQLEPPGRFLERVESTAPIDYDVLKAATGEREKAFIGVDYYQGHERGPSASSRKMEKQLRQRLGPWRDIGIEKAVQKACGVIRDHKRPDRIALKAMGFLKKKASNTNCLDMMVVSDCKFHVALCVELAVEVGAKFRLLELNLLSRIFHR